MSSYEIVKFQISLDKNKIEVQWNDNHVSRFHAKWIRFSCQCVRCCGTVTGIYLVDFVEFPDKMMINSVSIDKTSRALKVIFNNEVFPDHVTIAPIDWLREKCYCEDCLEDKLAKRDVITKTLRQREESGVNIIPTLQYDEVNNSDEGVFKWVKHLVEDGLCLIKNVPSEEGFVLAKKISNFEETNYGDTFEIKDIGEVNVAYTNFKLPLHQDQPMYENPPGYQFLHAVRFDACVTGGESVLADLFQAVDILRQESPEDFKVLCNVPTVYSTIDYSRGVYVESSTRNIVLDYYGKVVAVNWGPSILAPPQIKECDVDPYYKAHKALFKVIRRKQYQFRFRLEKGDMICFSNRRMLHAREAFQSNGGVRHLKGNYLKADDVKSRYMSLAYELGIKVDPPKIGNNSSI